MNEALRSHVTHTAFVLQLGRTHIATLVKLDLELTYERSLLVCGPVRRESFGRLLNKDSMAWHGLEDRGLVVHVFERNRHKHYDKNGHRKDVTAPIPPGDCWNITTAGRLVLELLKECGIYQEYAEAISQALLDGRPLPLKKNVVQGI